MRILDALSQVTLCVLLFEVLFKTFFSLALISFGARERNVGFAFATKQSQA
jgi:hypothetical protein